MEFIRIKVKEFMNVFFHLLDVFRLEDDNNSVVAGNSGQQAIPQNFLPRASVLHLRVINMLVELKADALCKPWKCVDDYQVRLTDGNLENRGA